MAEDRKAHDSPSSTGFDPAAVAVGFSAASREKADEFLDKQSRIAGLQIEDLEREDRVRHWSVRVRHISDVMKLVFEFLIGLVIILTVCGLGAMVWNAASDSDLVVDAFSVPPQIANTGLTGTALANRVLDRYSQIENGSSGILGAPVAFRRAADEVHLEIPETGVSLGQINRSLRTWLGHDVHVTGELVRTPTGLTLTVRYGDRPGKTFAGDAKSIDELATKAGDHIFASAQPYRYAEYLIENHHFDQAEKFIPLQALHGVPRDRARAYAAWGLLYLMQGNLAGAVAKNREALRLDPKSMAAHGLLSLAQSALGHEEKARANAVAVLRAISGATAKDFDPIHLRIGPPTFTVVKDSEEGNFSGVLAALRKLATLGNDRPGGTAEAKAEDHDLIGARRILAGLADRGHIGAPSLSTVSAQIRVALFEGNWPLVVREAEQVSAVAKQLPAARILASHIIWPLEAYARVKMGDIAGAKALISKTSRHCDACMRRRGQIAAAAKKMAEAKRDFAAVAARSPHEPYAETDWGTILLHHGRFDAAIAQFRIANEKGPHFADPLEMWGEALIAKKRSDLAVAKFDAAAKYAPQWGRLHLKWGEALLWSGDKQGAQKQFATAAKLYLTSSEKRQLHTVQVLAKAARH